MQCFNVYLVKNYEHLGYLRIFLVVFFNLEKDRCGIATTKKTQNICRLNDPKGSNFDLV